MTLPEALDPGALPGGIRCFLDQQYDREAVWWPSAAELGHLPLPDPDELAWLATQDDVESRLILTDSSAGRRRYRVENGPFDAERLAALPDDNWSLLLQDVDKHLPAMRAWFALVPFIPDWCIDDLMISVAAPGGSVGPHVDQYSVFLVQASGERRWQWTGTPPAPDPNASGQLRLVQPFDDGECRTAGPGDVLYLPPGIAHHGVAESLCTTCSIGMRGLQLDRIVDGAGDDRLFAFRPSALCAAPGEIPDAAIDQLTGVLPGTARAELIDAFGAEITTPKPWLAAEPPTIALPDALPLEVHGMSLIAWYRRRVWVNGVGIDVDDATTARVATLCRTRRLSVTDRKHWSDGSNEGMLEHMWRLGLFTDPDIGSG